MAGGRKPNAVKVTERYLNLVEGVADAARELVGDEGSLTAAKVKTLESAIKKYEEADRESEVTALE